LPPRGLHAGGFAGGCRLGANRQRRSDGIEPYGQLGDGTKTGSDVPTAVSGLSDITSLDGRERGAVALLGDGTLMAWGSNEVGQLGSAGRAGGATVTVSGAGFAVGSNLTEFKFGSIKARSASCASTTECSVVLGTAHATGAVDVKATANKASSAKNAPADDFTYTSWSQPTDRVQQLPGD
jgi:alpha-tubulin suppressor-like RCC1 family protein